MNVRFIKDYFKDSKLRASLNILTRENFGFDFEKWYQGGYYTGEYIPYSFLEENGEVISNASANIMEFAYTDKNRHIRKKNFIQIGTVMTKVEYRGKGYAGKLIQKIVEDYQEKCDGFYLFGNLSAISFYKKLGFIEGLQYKPVLKSDVNIIKEEPDFSKIQKSSPEMYINAVKNATTNTGFEHSNKYSLQMFYTGSLKNVYYSEKLDCYISYGVKDSTLYLQSVVSEKQIDVCDVLKNIPDEFKKVELGFTPQYREKSLFEFLKFDGGDDYRFLYIGNAVKVIEENQFYFPEYSHA